jgi:hypothetical protein
MQSTAREMRPSGMNNNSSDSALRGLHSIRLRTACDMTQNRSACTEADCARYADKAAFILTWAGIDVNPPEDTKT